jgi:hypothetical protein
LANVLVNKKMPRGPYDVFCIGDGKVDMTNRKAHHGKVNATDFVMANFAAIDAEVNVLTLYNPIPYDGARSELIEPGAYERHRKRFEKQIKTSVLPLLGLKWSDVMDVRLTLWGHALPLAAHGLYQGGIVDELRKPFRERVFFIEQDNWAYPSLQTGATESFAFKDQIIALMNA